MTMKLTTFFEWAEHFKLEAKRQEAAIKGKGANKPSPPKKPGPRVIHRT